jgi:hypothetical protein
MKGFGRANFFRVQISFMSRALESLFAIQHVPNQFVHRGQISTAGRRQSPRVNNWLHRKNHCQTWRKRIFPAAHHKVLVNWHSAC